MANVKSAKKRILVGAKKHDRNRTVRSAVKTRVANVRHLVEGGETTPTAELRVAVAALDRAAERGILHARNAARRKSRLMKMVAKAAALAADPEAAARAASEARAHAKGSGKTARAGSKTGGKTGGKKASKK